MLIFFYIWYSLNNLLYKDLQSTHTAYAVLWSPTREQEIETPKWVVPILIDRILRLFRIAVNSLNRVITDRKSCLERWPPALELKPLEEVISHQYLSELKWTEYGLELRRYGDPVTNEETWCFQDLRCLLFPKQFRSPVTWVERWKKGICWSKWYS